MLAMWPCTVFLTWMISYLFIFNLTHKTETAKGGETTNCNSPGPINPSTQSTTGVRIQCALCQPPHHIQKMLGQNHFAERFPHVLTFLYQKFCLQCTGVVALSTTYATKFSHSGWRTLSQVIFLNASLTKPIDNCLWSPKPQGGTQLHMDSYYI